MFNPKDWDLVSTDESPPRTKGVAEATPKAPPSKPFSPTDFPDGYSLVAEYLAETNFQNIILKFKSRDGFFIFSFFPMMRFNTQPGPPDP